MALIYLPSCIFPMDLGYDSQVKGFEVKSNTTFKLKDVRDFVESLIR